MYRSTYFGFCTDSYFVSGIFIGIGFGAFWLAHDQPQSGYLGAA
jgi:hypothetical protein